MLILVIVSDFVAEVPDRPPCKNPMKTNQFATKLINFDDLFKIHTWQFFVSHIQT